MRKNNYFKTLVFCSFLVFCFLISAMCIAEEDIITSHAITLYGEDPKYKADFTHFDYVNPNAPKAGTLRLAGGASTFDNFNIFSLKGTPPSGLGLLAETLTVASKDEPFTRYGLIAEKMEYPKDRAWIIFHLRPEAKFHDGSPITAEDVVFSFDTFRKRFPHYQHYFKDVASVEILDSQRVKFTFKSTTNRELALIVSEFPVCQKKFWETQDLDKISLTLWPGSGPYKIASFDPGRSITYERVKDYWGKDLAVNKGEYNFDQVIYEYYLDSTVKFEAFKSGAYDIHYESVAKNWATAYDILAIEKGWMIKEEIVNHQLKPMQAWVFNVRKPIFQDRRVRQAISMLFDFEWSNKNLMYGQYQRAKSFWSNSDLGSTGMPSPEELAILELYRGKIPDELFTTAYEPPTTDGSGNIRDNVKKAIALLDEAGWVLENGVMVHKTSKTPLSFTFLYPSQDDKFMPLTNAFIKNLQKAGIQANVQMVDTPRYIELVRNHDFDIVTDVFGQSVSPGNEQRDYWGSQAASSPNTNNTAGIQNPAIDDLIEKLIQAPDRQSLINYTRALDRILLWENYVIPHYVSFVDRLVYWDKFDRPDHKAKLYVGYNPLESLIFTWWYDAEKAKKIDAVQKRK